MYLTYSAADEICGELRRRTGLKVTTDSAQALGWHDAGERCLLVSVSEVEFDTSHHYATTWDIYAFPGRGDDHEQAYRTLDSTVYMVHERAYPVEDVRFATVELGGRSQNVAIMRLETDHDL